MSNVTVVGAGVMGHNIAIEFAMYGHTVSIYDEFEEARNRVMDRIEKDLQFMVDCEFIDAARKEGTLANITVYDNLEDSAKDADFVVEAIVEYADVKAELFRKLDSICRQDTIFCTNTSSLSLESIIHDLPEDRRQKCLVAHYFNPANIIPCIELSLFGDTTQDTFDKTADLYRSVEKHPIRVLKDVPGMVGNRLQLTLYREAAYMLDEGITTAEDIDECLKYGPAFRYAAIGMLGSYDMNGIALTRHVADNIWPDLCNAADTNGGILEKMDAEGKDGIRSGEGFFKYPKEKEEEFRANYSRKLLMQLKVSQQYPKYENKE